MDFLFMLKSIKMQQRLVKVPLMSNAKNRDMNVKSIRSSVPMKKLNI